MADFGQYRHFLYFAKVGDSIQDENGDWTDATFEWVKVEPKCRYEVSGQANNKKTEDGHFEMYGGMIYAPTNCPFLRLGTNIIVTKDPINAKLFTEDNYENLFAKNILLFKGIVKGFDKGRFHCRIYV